LRWLESVEESLKKGEGDRNWRHNNRTERSGEQFGRGRRPHRTAMPQEELLGLSITNTQLGIIHYLLVPEEVA
jgi:hypothetical protein